MALNSPPSKTFPPSPAAIRKSRKVPKYPTSELFAPHPPQNAPSLFFFYFIVVFFLGGGGGGGGGGRLWEPCEVLTIA